MGSLPVTTAVVVEGDDVDSVAASDIGKSCRDAESTTSHDSASPDVEACDTIPRPVPFRIRSRASTRLDFLRASRSTRRLSSCWEAPTFHVASKHDAGRQVSVLLGPRTTVCERGLPAGPYRGYRETDLLSYFAGPPELGEGSAKVVTDAGTDLAHVRREDRGVRKDLSLRGWAAIREHG
jgi:hypothetical protein